MVPKFIAIDPAYVNNASGFAYHISGDSVYTGTLSSQDKRSIEEILSNAQGISEPCTHLIIEGCYLGKNPLTFKRLTEAITRITMVAEGLGYTVIEVGASTWQAAMLTVSGHSPRDRAAIKAQAGWVARNVMGTRGDLSEHQHDAACILGYAEAMARMTCRAERNRYADIHRTDRTETANRRNGLAR